MLYVLTGAFLVGWMVGIVWGILIAMKWEEEL